MTAALDELIKMAGVVGAGGAGFPTHIKVAAKVDTVLVNGASCEPLLMSDIVLMEEQGASMLRGLCRVLDHCRADRGIVCLKGKHRQAVAAMEQATAGDPRLSVHVLGDFYPMGDEHILVNEVLGRTVPEAGLPLQVGALVTNVESLINIDRAVAGLPVTHRYLTVAGAVANPSVMRVPVGSLVSEVIAWAGGTTIADYRIVDGGPMMGRVLADAGQPVTKTTSGILVLPADHNVVRAKVMDPEKLRRFTQTVCCQCTMCTDLCPRYLLGHSLHPHKLMRGFGNKLLSGEIAREALLCSECGICEKFACPMLISPREINVQIKQELRAKGIRWQSSSEPLVQRALRQERNIPTGRLIERLDLGAYHHPPSHDQRDFNPKRVMLLLQQHIGAAAIPVVTVGSQVKVGDLVGEIPDQAMGARIHASICGRVSAVSATAIIIEQHPQEEPCH